MKARGWLYRGARIMGDYNALKRGRVPQRLGRRVTGRMAGRLLGRLWR